MGAEPLCIQLLRLTSAPRFVGLHYLKFNHGQLYFVAPLRCVTPNSVPAHWPRANIPSGSFWRLIDAACGAVRKETIPAKAAKPR